MIENAEGSFTYVTPDQRFYAGGAERRAWLRPE
jgi:hypothetical protein